LEKEILKDYDLIRERFQELDMHYIQPRYPNGFSNGYPAEYYNKKVAKKCIKYAESINKFAKEKIKEISSFG
jgi:HEPN domain-containing protein